MSAALPRYGTRPAQGRRSARRWRGRGPRRSRKGEPRTRLGLLPLGVLRRLAGLLQAVLLALLHPGVAGEEAGLLQRRPRLGVTVDERTRDAESHRTRLTGDAAALDAHEHVVPVGHVEGLERLVD